MPESVRWNRRRSGQPFPNNFISPTRFSTPSAGLAELNPVAADPCGKITWKSECGAESAIRHRRVFKTRTYSAGVFLTTMLGFVLYGSMRVRPHYGYRSSCGAVWGMVQRQASMLAFVDTFRAMAVVFLLVLPFLLIMKKPVHQKSAGPMH